MPNFLRFLWPNPPEGYISTWTKSNVVRFFSSYELDIADTYLKSISTHEDAYFTVAMLGQKPAKGRGSASDVAYLSCMHADFDLTGDQNVHAQTALPKSIEELRSFFTEAAIPKPSVWVNSGNGIHAYWRLDQPLDLRTPDGRERGGAVLRNFQQSIRTLAQTHRGWKFDNTSDLARVLRYPGTKNHKTTPPKSVEIL